MAIYVAIVALVQRECRNRNISPSRWVFTSTTTWIEKTEHYCIRNALSHQYLKQA
jgi:hypothetical protein